MTGLAIEKTHFFRSSGVHITFHDSCNCLLLHLLLLSSFVLLHHQKKLISWFQEKYTCPSSQGGKQRDTKPYSE